MSLRTRCILLVVWLLSLCTVAAMSQTPRVTTPEPSSEPNKIFSGSDLGFRLDGYQGSVPVGTFVVHVKGRWIQVEPKFLPQLRKTLQ